MEQLRSAIRSAVPQLELAASGLRVSAALERIVADALAPQYQELIDSLTRQVHVVELPSLKLDYQSLFPNLEALRARSIEPLVPALAALHDLQREQFADIISTARSALDAALPPNWRAANVTVPSDLETLLLDEGMPLAWVPPSDIVGRLFSATTASERRRIIGARWKRIARSCVVELDQLSDPDLDGHASFARKAADALLGGSHEASQALSANLLDTILRVEFSPDSRKAATDQKDRPDVDDYPLRVALVVGGIWGAHGRFQTVDGDQVPRAFSRHASVHGVSRRQYSRINAVLALMHVVSLLRLLDADLRHL